MTERSNGNIERLRSTSASAERPPIRISKIAGRYLVFSIDDLMHARRHHRLCPVFSGTTPQNPQQNAFTGLPAELMPEEAAILVRGGFAYVVDDAAVHTARLSGLAAGRNGGHKDEGLDKYLGNVRDIGCRVQEAFEEQRQIKQQAGLQKQKNKKGKKKTQSDDANDGDGFQEAKPRDESHETIGDLFQAPPPSSQAKQAKQNTPHAVTPTSSGSLVSSSPFSPPPIPSFLLPSSFTANVPSSAVHTAPIDNLPLSYPLFAHLHDLGYFMMPGLRFGCDYNVYPGDPLRFHSHFQATALHYDDPDEEFSLLDLGAGGRLGTGVKKSFLIGGAVTGSGTGSSKDEKKKEGEEGDHHPKTTSLETPPVRAFSIEWAGM